MRITSIITTRTMTRSTTTITTYTSHCTISHMQQTQSQQLIQTSWSIFDHCGSTGDVLCHRLLPEQPNECDWSRFLLYENLVMEEDLESQRWLRRLEMRVQREQTLPASTTSWWRYGRKEIFRKIKIHTGMPKWEVWKVDRKGFRRAWTCNWHLSWNLKWNIHAIWNFTDTGNETRKRFYQKIGRSTRNLPSKKKSDKNKNQGGKIFTHVHIPSPKYLQ